MVVGIMGRVWTLRENLVLGLVIFFLERVLMECWLGGAGGAGLWLGHWEGFHLWFRYL